MKFLFFDEYKYYCKYKDLYGQIRYDDSAIIDFVFTKGEFPKYGYNYHNPYFEARNNKGTKYYYFNGDLIGTNSKRQLIALNKLYIKKYFLFKNNKQWKKYVKMQVFK